MSEQRLALLIAGGGILCLLLQIVVSLNDSSARRAQATAQRVAFESVHVRAEKRAARLSTRLAAALTAGDRRQMQAELDQAALADPELVEIGLVDKDKDLTVLVSSDQTRGAKTVSGPAEPLVRESMAAGGVRKIEDSPQQQRVTLVAPVVSQKTTIALLYLVLTTAGLEDDLNKVSLAMQPPRVPAWLTIGLGLIGLGAAIFMLITADKKQQVEALRVQEVVEQMAMGHVEARLDPVDVPHLSGIAQHLNVLADNVQLLQQEQLEGTEHATRMAQELQDAQVVQQTLMPEVREIARGPLQLCGVYRSASKLSGDWWNYFPLDEHRTLLVLADVVGHGIGSAVVGAMAYGGAMQLHQQQQSTLRPELLLQRLNQAIWATTHGKFTMSCFAVIIDTQANQLTFASGAQAFPLLYRPRDTAKPFIPLVAAGSPLGSGDAAKFEASTQPYEPGDMLICYTDGLIEAANAAGDQFGDKRVRQTVQKSSNRRVKEICEELLGEVSRFVSTAELEDDQTLVVARHAATPQGGSASGSLL